MIRRAQPLTFLSSVAQFGGEPRGKRPSTTVLSFSDISGGSAAGCGELISPCPRGKQSPQM